MLFRSEDAGEDAAREEGGALHGQLGNMTLVLVWWFGRVGGGDCHLELLRFWL